MLDLYDQVGMPNKRLAKQSCTDGTEQGRSTTRLGHIGPWLKLPIPCTCLKGMAGTTGLEPAASAVTGQRSNQLNYVPTRQINEIRIASVYAGMRNLHDCTDLSHPTPDCLPVGPQPRI